MYYFGVWGEAGHFFWDVDRRRLNDRAFPDDFPLCNPNFIDGPMAPRRSGEQQGLCRIWRTQGWAVVAFWDRTGDSRMGSNSAFIARLQGNPTDSEIVHGCAAAFPEIAHRIGNKLTLLNGQEFLF